MWYPIFFLTMRTINKLCNNKWIDKYNWNTNTTTIITTTTSITTTTTTTSTNGYAYWQIYFKDIYYIIVI